MDCDCVQVVLIHAFILKTSVLLQLLHPLRTQVQCIHHSVLTTTTSLCRIVSISIPLYVEVPIGALPTRTIAHRWE